MQGKRRLCWGNVFYGMMRDRFERSLGRRSAVAAGEPGPFVADGAGRNRRGDGHGRAWSHDLSLGRRDGGRCASRFTPTPSRAITPSGQPNWIELKPADRDDCGGSWQAGEVFIVSVKIVPDAAARAWYTHNEGVQFLFGTGSNSGFPPDMSQRWSPEGSDQQMVMFGLCPKAGEGPSFVRLPAHRLQRDRA